MELSMWPHPGGGRGSPKKTLPRPLLGCGHMDKSIKNLPLAVQIEFFTLCRFWTTRSRNRSCRKCSKRGPPKTTITGTACPACLQDAPCFSSTAHAHTTFLHFTFLRGLSGVAPLCSSVRPTNASEFAKNDSSRGPEDLRARC